MCNVEIDEELKRRFFDSNKEESAFIGRVMNYIANLKQSNKHPMPCEHNISPKEACYKCYVASTQHTDTPRTENTTGAQKAVVTRMKSLDGLTEESQKLGMYDLPSQHKFPILSQVLDEGAPYDEWKFIKDFPSQPSETNEQQLKRELPAFKLAAKDFMKDASPEQIQNYLDKIVPTQNPFNAMQATAHEGDRIIITRAGGKDGMVTTEHDIATKTRE